MFIWLLILSVNTQTLEQFRYNSMKPHAIIRIKNKLAESNSKR